VGATAAAPAVTAARAARAGAEPVSAPVVPPVVPVAGVAAALDEAPRPVRFGLRAPEARRVALVGDFNRWDPVATPLARTADGWEVEVALTPGRHAYAFVVDGARWVLDPAAQRERDPDFGQARSVTVVGLEPAP
jgi:1,4-alpha-glucan branching enzyme